MKPKIKNGFRLCSNNAYCKHNLGPLLPETFGYFQLKSGVYSDECLICLKTKTKKRKPNYKLNIVRKKPDRYEAFKPKSGWGFIYFIYAKEVNRVKIGFSQNPKQRLSDMKVGSPVELKIIGQIEGDRYIERNLHFQFRKYRFAREWFDVKESLLDYLINNFNFNG